MGHPRIGEKLYLVRAQVLHSVDIGDLEFVAGDERIDPLQGGLEVPK